MTHAAATYVAAAILQRATPFLLLPLFTRILAPAEFGQVGIVTAMAAAVTVIVSLGLESAVFRGYVQAAAGPDGPRAFVSSVGAFAVVAPMALSIVFAIGLAPAAASAFHVPVDAIRFAAIGAALGAAGLLVPLALLRAQERLRDYLQLTGLQVIITPSLTVLFVATLGWGVTGWMLAYMLSNGVLLVRGIGMIRRDLTPQLELQHIRRALVFGLPLVPHAAAHWVLSVSDRAILGTFVAVADVGAYYAAYVFSLPVSLVSVAISQATQPLYVGAMQSMARREQLGSVVTVHVLLVILITAIMGLVGPPAQVLFLPAAYQPAAAFIPWLAVGAGLFGLYLVPMSIIVLTVGRTGRVWAITVTAALANLLLNLLLIPGIGTLAAAINATIGYGLLLAGVSVYARRVSQPFVSLEIGRIGLGAVMVGVPAVATAMLTPGNSVFGLVVRTSVMLAVTGALVATGPLRTETQAALRALRSAGATGRT